MTESPLERSGERTATLREIALPLRAEWGWWIAYVGAFALGSMWTYILMLAAGSQRFWGWAFLGIALGALGLVVGRLCRVIWDHVRHHESR